MNTTSLPNGDAQFAKRFWSAAGSEAPRRFRSDGTNRQPATISLRTSLCGQGRIQSAVVAGALPAHSKRWRVRCPLSYALPMPQLTPPWPQIYDEYDVAAEW